MRNQGEMMVRDQEGLVAEAHPVRAIWAFLEQLASTHPSAFMNAANSVINTIGLSTREALPSAPTRFTLGCM